MVYEVITDCGFIFYILSQAIHRFLYFNDIEIIVLVHRCMLLLLPIIDGPPPVRVNAPCKVSLCRSGPLHVKPKGFVGCTRLIILFIRKSFLMAH